MTHEQKPESAEFRTQEELEALASGYISRHYLPDCWADVGEMIDEMMAAGAAEQRRKDAEGAEPVGYRMGPLKSSPDNGPWLSTTWLIQAAPPPPMPGVRIEPLYTRPANVAALEARVVELEGVLRNVRDAIEKSDPKVLVCTLWMNWPSETVVDYISAAIREGGEHG